MIFGFISLVLFGWLLFPRVTGWIIFLIAISLVSALGSSFSFEKQTYLHGDQQQQELVHGGWKHNGLPFSSLE
jgi:glucan phosphoethanolaminetransferase (alkaline phosphatase superfamily)